MLGIGHSTIHKPFSIVCTITEPQHTLFLSGQQNQTQQTGRYSREVAVPWELTGHVRLRFIYYDTRRRR
jgi:hypothetical protein